jgi:hypothetical protein
MTPYDDADGLRMNIAELEALLSRQAVSAEGRVTGLAALVGAKATLRALEAMHMDVTTLRDDVVSPLLGPLAKFPEAATGLAAGLRRLPDH